MYCTVYKCVSKNSSNGKNGRNEILEYYVTKESGTQNLKNGKKYTTSPTGQSIFPDVGLSLFPLASHHCYFPDTESVMLQAAASHTHSMVSASEAKEARVKVDQFKKSVTDEGERLVKEVFPQRILELNELLAKPPFTATDLTQFHSSLNIPVPEPRGAEHQDVEQPVKRRKVSGDNGVAAAVPAVDGTKVMALPSGPVPCNKVITDIIETLKPVCRAARERLRVTGRRDSGRNI